MICLYVVPAAQYLHETNPAADWIAMLGVLIGAFFLGLIISHHID